MKFNPITKGVYSDNGQFLKQMSCPYNVSWVDLQPVNNTARKCSKCDHLIIDTSCLDDAVLVQMLNSNPNACLKLDLNQKNIKIISNGLLEQK
jgi:hypothetical protein